jgi:hypothetical protein
VLERFDFTMRRIEEFVGVAPLEIRQPLQKQARAAIHEAVVNYAELCQTVAGSKYAAYL